jgi:glycosyltransferase involved in cell wall biosynthesis
MLATALRDRGHDVLLLCRPGSQLQERMRGVVPQLGIVKGPDLGPPVILKCMHALRAHRSNVMLALMDKDLRLSGVAARCLGIPVVIRKANDQPLRGGFAKFFYTRVATHVVVNSQATRVTLVGSTPALASRNIDVIYNGIDADVYQQAIPAELQLPAGAIAFGFIGRFEERKGILELLQAWPNVVAAVPQAHLIFAGKGELELEMQHRLGRDANVHFLGYRTDVPSLLRSFDVIVMPSHWEGFGLVAAEAMAAGRAVIASHASSLPELIRDGVNGRTVPPRDARSLADAMIEMARDPALRDRFGRQGLSIARTEFSLVRMIDQWEALLERVSRKTERRTPPK